MTSLIVANGVLPVAVHPWTAESRAVETREGGDSLTSLQAGENGSGSDEVVPTLDPGFSQGVHGETVSAAYSIVILFVMTRSLWALD